MEHYERYGIYRYIHHCFDRLMIRSFDGMMKHQGGDIYRFLLFSITHNYVSLFRYILLSYMGSAKEKEEAEKNWFIGKLSKYRIPIEVDLRRNNNYLLRYLTKMGRSQIIILLLNTIGRSDRGMENSIDATESGEDGEPCALLSAAKNSYWSIVTLLLRFEYNRKVMREDMMELSMTLIKMAVKSEYYLRSYHEDRTQHTRYQQEDTTKVAAISVRNFIMRRISVRDGYLESLGVWASFHGYLSLLSDLIETFDLDPTFCNNVLIKTAIMSGNDSITDYLIDMENISLNFSIDDFVRETESYSRGDLFWFLTSNGRSFDLSIPNP